jgi:hypothetical protein
MQKYYLNNKEVSEEEFYSSNNLSVSNPFRGEKQVNEAVKEAIGLSTRHKAGEKMIYLDEAIEQEEKLKEVKDRLNLAEGYKQEFLDTMYFNNPNLITQEEYDKLEKDDTITNVSRGEGEKMTKLDKAIAQWKELIDGAVEAQHGVKETEGKGIKLNELKPQMSLLFKQFPKALEAIVRCSEYGHNKYKETDKDYLNFKRVEGGSKAYADAGLRHRMQQGIDLESMLPHCYHVAWNALAELELLMEEK